MRIVVIGAGGIGGWLGARLASTGQQVGFLVHGGTLEALRSEGLTLLDGSGGEPGTVTARIDEPLVSQDPGTLVDALGGHPDLVFVTTKVDALPGLAPALRRLIGPGTGVVSTQNGISAPGMLAGAVGTEHVLPGVARVYSAVVSPGNVRTIGSAGSLALGEWDGAASALTAGAVGVLEVAGIRAWVPDSIWAELWRKVSFVAVQGHSVPPRTRPSASCAASCATSSPLPWARWSRLRPRWGTTWPPTTSPIRSPPSWPLLTPSPPAPPPRCNATSPPAAQRARRPGRFRVPCRRRHRSGNPCSRSRPRRPGSERGPRPGPMVIPHRSGIPTGSVATSTRSGFLTRTCRLKAGLPSHCNAFAATSPRAASRRRDAPRA